MPLHAAAAAGNAVDYSPEAWHLRWKTSFTPSRTGSFEAQARELAATAIAKGPLQVDGARAGARHRTGSLLLAIPAKCIRMVSPPLLSKHCRGVDSALQWMHVCTCACGAEQARSLSRSRVCGPTHRSSSVCRHSTALASRSRLSEAAAAVSESPQRPLQVRRRLARQLRALTTRHWIKKAPQVRLESWRRCLRPPAQTAALCRSPLAAALPRFTAQPTSKPAAMIAAELETLGKLATKVVLHKKEGAPATASPTAAAGQPTSPLAPELR